MTYINPPLNNINGSLVNIDNSHYSGSAFDNRISPSQVNPNVLPVPRNSIEALKEYIPCPKGGYKNKKNSKTKFKNISNMYKMKGGKSTISKIKKQIQNFFTLKRQKGSKKSIKKTTKKTYSRKNKSNKNRKVLKGGYSQYQNNLPMTQTYSTGGPLTANQSALASPVPFKVLPNCTNCVDNYSYFTNKGFPSRGWN